MAMSYIWLFMLLASVVSALLGGNVAETGAAVMHGAQQAVTLSLSIAGAICLWSGVAKLMHCSGLSEKLAKLLRPLLGRLFPTAARDREAFRLICANFTANLLGLGNAATPMGIAAVKRMQTLGSGDGASNEMCRLVVLNTASIQLIPSTVSALRASMGAETPFDILPAVWITSICSVTAGLLAARLMERSTRQ